MKELEAVRIVFGSQFQVQYFKMKGVFSPNFCNDLWTLTPGKKKAKNKKQMENFISLNMQFYFPLIHIYHSLK